MIDQLLNEMKVTRWVQRNNNLASEDTATRVDALYFGVNLVAYIDVSVMSDSEEMLLEKMLAAIGLSKKDCRGEVDFSMPLLNDGADNASQYAISFKLSKLNTISSPDSKREAWKVLQQLRDKIHS
jgi:hypothetical protein